jgi:hypothetical protein
MTRACQLEYVSSGSDSGTPCGKPAVAECADCGASICSDCRFECCGGFFLRAILRLSHHTFMFKEAGSKPASFASNFLPDAQQGQLRES